MQIKSVSILKTASPIQNLDIIAIKQEKHQKEAAPILNGLINPIEALQRGCEKAIASFIKLGKEKVYSSKLFIGPQNKNEATQFMQKLIAALLHNFDSVRFTAEPQAGSLEPIYYVEFDGIHYEFLPFLKAVNFNHISFTVEEQANYHKLILSGALQHQPELPGCQGCPTEHDFMRLDPNGLCSMLSLSEKIAINVYAGGGMYRSMNQLLRGEITNAIDSNYLVHGLDQEIKVNQTIKEALLHSAIAVAALNKLPDFEAPLGENGQPLHYLYRAENFLPDPVLQARKEAAAAQALTWEMGFVSTSHTTPNPFFFGPMTEVVTLFKNVKGKDITPLSKIGDYEREILIPPTQVQWLYHKAIINLNNNAEKAMDLFIARPVTVPNENQTFSYDRLV